MTALDSTIHTIDQLSGRGLPDAPALVVGDRTFTYRELDRGCRRAAGTLRRLGVREGDRVASWMGKTELACMLPLACAGALAIHVPINPALKRGQVRHILEDCRAKVLIANEARLRSLGPEDARGVRLVALEEWDGLPREAWSGTGGVDDTVALLYTSGSTGRPKGVMLSHANLWLGAASVAHYLGLAAKDRTLCVLPLAFDYGQNQLLSTWHAGGCAVAFDYLLPRDVVRAVEREGATVLAGVPPLWLQLAEQEWGEAGRSLRTLTNSGGHLPLAAVRRLRGLFPQARLHLMYGLTEAFRSASLDPALVDAHPDAVGTAIPFAELRVVRADGSAADIGEEGELVHAGPLVAKGYWNDPVRTAERFRDGEVWSGDRVTLGEDGLLRIRGRDDAMIKVSGHRVSPTEVEEAALASGAVADCAAFGVPDARLGQSIVLIAVAKGADAEDRLRRHFAAELPAHLRPARVEWRDTLPLSANGKIDRATLAGELAA